MAEDTIIVTAPQVLAVEGKDERMFFNALLRFMVIDGVQIIEIGGKDKFKRQFAKILNNNDDFFDTVQSIGFVRDAEDNEADSAFQSICNIIKPYGLPCPSKPSEVVVHGAMRVGVFIMPNNEDSGMLENLCIEAAKTDSVWECVEAFTTCYKSKIDLKNYNPAKAQIQAFLSTRIPIVSALGIAAQQHVWDFSKPCFEPIKSFLSKLFISEVHNV
jgi:hypothetical protein